MIVVIMGVTGAGKTTIGSRLAADLEWPFYEGDEFHPKANVEKMSRGVSLTDEDRRPWLETLAALIGGLAARGESAVIACSALKESYRRRLRGGHPEVVFVHLEADPRLIAARLKARTGHFAKADLLPSQLAALERPEHAVIVDVSGTPGEIAAEIRRRLGLK